MGQSRITGPQKDMLLELHKHGRQLSALFHGNEILTMRALICKGLIKESIINFNKELAICLTDKGREVAEGLSGVVSQNTPLWVRWG